jgi:hypothetical protein
MIFMVVLLDEVQWHMASENFRGQVAMGPINYFADGQLRSVSLGRKPKSVNSVNGFAKYLECFKRDQRPSRTVGVSIAEIHPQKHDARLFINHCHAGLDVGMPGDCFPVGTRI